MGYETAQANAAFILSQSPPPCPAWPSPETVAALAQAAQGGGEDGQAASAAIIAVDQWEASRNYSEFSTEGRGSVESSREESSSSSPEAGEGEGGVAGTGRVYATSDLFEARALSLYRQSALQGNAGSFRKMGDMHYYGSGGLARDKHEAALLYQLAADYGQTHAMFNLGVMHEPGDGVEQDFHLAKRFYDQTAEYDPSARVPSLLAVYFLRAHKEFQLLVGKETTDRVGAVAMRVLAPLFQISDWRDAVTSVLFPERNTSVHFIAGGADAGEYQQAGGAGQQQQQQQESLSPLSLLLWRGWDKLHAGWSFVLARAQGVSEYLLRFSNRFMKSPQHALASLLEKAKELINSGGGGGSDEEEGDTSTTAAPPDTRPASAPSSAPSPLPEASSGFLNLDPAAEADLELILLLALLLTFLVLLDHGRQRQRAIRRRARERRRREWETVSVVEMRSLILLDSERKRRREEQQEEQQQQQEHEEQQAMGDRAL
jgi:TPR repeat protein